jgi:streptogramin lyase
MSLSLILAINKSRAFAQEFAWDCGMPFIPSGLAVAPDDAVWVSVTGHNAIYRLDAGSGQFKRFAIPTHLTENAQP